MKKENKEPPELEKTEDNKTLIINNHKVPLSNLSKLYWPDEKITKGAMIEYYETMAKVILPYLKNRPLSLKRNPNGILDEGFFQKDAGEHTPSWVKKVNVQSGSEDKIIHYIMCNDKITQCDQG